MGRERQKRKSRSGLSKVQHKQPTKSGKKKINFLGNALLAANWDKSQTLTQNYRRLGLTSKLNAPSGGIEKGGEDGFEAEQPVDRLHIVAQGKAPKTIQPGQVQVERDPTSGRILRVVRPASPSDNDVRSRRNPLNDPLNDISDSDSEYTAPAVQSKPSRKPKGIVGVLEAQADAEAAMPAKRRHQSTREGEWVARLVEKHRGDFRAMSRDRRLNVMQQSEGDLRRRVGRWMEDRGGRKWRVEDGQYESTK